MRDFALSYCILFCPVWLWSLWRNRRGVNLEERGGGRSLGDLREITVQEVFIWKECIFNFKKEMNTKKEKWTWKFKKAKNWYILSLPIFLFMGASTWVCSSNQEPHLIKTVPCSPKAIACPYLLSYWWRLKNYFILHARMLTCLMLYRSYASNKSCCVFMSIAVLAYPEDTVVLQASLNLDS